MTFILRILLVFIHYSDFAARTVQYAQQYNSKGLQAPPIEFCIAFSLVNYILIFFIKHMHGMLSNLAINRPAKSPAVTMMDIFLTTAAAAEDEQAAALLLHL